MLIPLSRQKFEQLIPLVATGAQYKHAWGKFPDFLRRVLISISALASILFIGWLLPIEELRSVRFFLGLFAMTYWLWSPVLEASLQNISYRKNKFAGFLRGRIVDVYITDELIGQEENVNSRGDLVIVENRERKINLEIEDESGFDTRIQASLKREHQAIAPGDTVELMVLSNRSDLSRIVKITDVFLPRNGIWVSDYPYLRRDEFEAVSRRLERDDRPEDGEYQEPRSRQSVNEFEDDDLPRRRVRSDVRDSRPLTRHRKRRPGNLSRRRSTELDEQL
ncbi:MAG: phosphate ABC transporter permease [Leptolyngbyaceae cyanobacterium SU_3_3]|nr:phosphate ABC transporter permease [Leptolyngbyaceae cyanobacterium SU_3_3]